MGHKVVKRAWEFSEYQDQSADIMGDMKGTGKKIKTYGKDTADGMKKNKLRY